MMCMILFASACAFVLPAHAGTLVGQMIGKGGSAGFEVAREAPVLEIPGNI